MHAPSGESRCSPSAARGAGRFFLDLGVKKLVFRHKKRKFVGCEKSRKSDVEKRAFFLLRFLLAFFLKSFCDFGSILGGPGTSKNW